MQTETAPSKNSIQMSGSVIGCSRPLAILVMAISVVCFANYGLAQKRFHIE